jgi:DNA-binding response OmpR family regulator
LLRDKLEYDGFVVETSETRTVDNFIFRLRHELEPDPKHPTYIRRRMAMVIDRLPLVASW